MLDLRSNRGEALLDFNSHIQKRAISGDPNVVSSIAIPFVEGLDEAGVGATLKHFPGLGRVSEDTHHFRAAINENPEILEQTDWLPFQQTLAKTNAAIMVGHVVVPALDPTRPASQSAAVIQGILREKWRFDRLVVTDDMLMTPVFKNNICEGVSASLNAGVDILLIAYDGRHYYRLMDCVLTAARENRLYPSILNASDQRLAAFAARKRQ